MLRALVLLAATLSLSLAWVAVPSHLSTGQVVSANLSVTNTGSTGFLVWPGGATQPSPRVFQATGNSAFTQESWLATALVGPPVPRVSHKAVWTGSRMIVWGGQTLDGVLLGDGAFYTPVTNTWSPMSGVGAPSPRIRHSAVWTGSKMIVWGGLINCCESTNTGGIYDPATDSWSQMSLTNAPSPRSIHTALWTGSKMIVWNGQPSYTNTGSIYDPVTDSWTTMSTTGAPLIFVEEQQTAVWTGSHMIVWGTDDVSLQQSKGASYDPATDTWEAISTVGAPSARESHAAVWTGSRMLVWGGFVSGGATATGGSYDPTADTWAPISMVGAPTARMNHSLVWARRQMIVWGGYDGTYLNSGGIYDPSADNWTATSVADAPSGRTYHTALWASSRMVVWGGYVGAPPQALNDGGIYRPPMAGTDFYTMLPCRIADSRQIGGPFGGLPLSAGTERKLTVAGACGIPAAAIAVSLNVTVTQPTADGNVRLYPGGTPTPLASTVNFGTGQTRANNTIATLGTNGDVTLLSSSPSYGATVHLIIDVSDYFW